MEKKEYKVGDRVLVRGGYHANIIGIKDGWFGKKYICKWNIHDFDYDYTYGTSGVKRAWQILCKN